MGDVETPWYIRKDFGLDDEVVTMAAIRGQHLDGLTEAGRAYYDAVRQQTIELEAQGFAVESYHD